MPSDGKQAGALRYDERMASDRIVLDPDPVIDAFKKDIDRTLLRENLELTVEERILKMQAALRAMLEERENRH